ncbi:MAG: heat-inducible transcription repressor HrcA [Clostridia bacterium]|nr:heat-inducible transcription repressor HrcA [Clostridia bacterium]
MKEISERKIKILHAVVDEYIAQAEPVSSKEIQQKYLPALSPATIRSELSALEDMGYLVQPHVSAGRIPSGKAYKLYVDKLMSKKSLTPTEMHRIKSYLDDKMVKVEDIVRRTAKVISDITNYTSVILIQNIENVTIKEIKLVDLTDGSALLIVITDSGIIRDNIINIPEDVGDTYVEVAGGLLNEIFSGKQLKDIEMPTEMIDGELNKFRTLFESVFEVIRRHGREEDSGVYLEGSRKMLDYPEYAGNIDKVKNLLEVIDTKEKLSELMSASENSLSIDGSPIELTVKIDSSDGEDGLADCSVISAKYTIRGKEIGQVGVIGPTRMNYDKVVSVLNYITKTLNREE